MILPTSREAKRKKLLKLLEDYDDFPGFLGESFCEDHYNLHRTPKGTKDIDGCINGVPVQVKCKITKQSFDRWYVAFKNLTCVDWQVLIVTYADCSDQTVRLLGLWMRQQVLDVLKNSSESARKNGRVSLKKLSELPPSPLPDEFPISKTGLKTRPGRKRTKGHP